MSDRLQTNISQAFWCEAAGFKPACVWRRGESREHIYWLDRLFCGGIVLPESKERALTILLSGPPGTGKSTLAQELCFRWSAADRMSSWYIALESRANWIVERARSYGWGGTRDTHHAGVFRVADFSEPDSHTGTEADARHVTVLDMPNANELRRFLARWPRQKSLIRAFHDLIYAIDPSEEETDDQQDTGGPDVLVVDSLNTVAEDDKGSVLRRLDTLAASGPRVLIVVLDSAPSGARSEFWEFASDIVIQLNRKYSSEYMIRTIEIIKARFQQHVWGKHQLKIYEPYQPSDPLKDQDRRAFPFREEGGIFILPSIHYVLSDYKRSSPAQQEYMECPLEELQSFLKSGFPKGRCTAFLGSRGGHKSHLGYVQVLHQLVEPANRGIVVSLRDDEHVTKETMQGIINEFNTDGGALPGVTKLIAENRLEVLYYPPGYITPEEFFHRLMLSVHRLKTTRNTAITLLFNSLDQLSSRFPLCAKEDIFVPGIVQMLCAENVTTFFVAAKEADQPPEYYGLDAMAELILSFERESISRKRYCDHAAKAYAKRVQEIGAAETSLPKKRNAVVVRVDRFAGGHAAGARGILELVDRRDDALYDIFGRIGLHFVPYQ